MSIHVIKVWRVLCYLFFIINHSIPFSESRRSQCYNCHNICYEATNGEAKIIANTLNSTCVTDCLNFPFKRGDITLAMTECNEPGEKCFTAHALMKYKVHSDGSFITLRYLLRGCTPNCPIQVCDFSKLRECKFAPEVINFMEKKIHREIKVLETRIYSAFEGEKLIEYGMGGEIRCCKSDGCNNDKETTIAHKYIRDEF